MKLIHAITDTSRIQRIAFLFENEFSDIQIEKRRTDISNKRELIYTWQKVQVSNKNILLTYSQNLQKELTNLNIQPGNYLYTNVEDSISIRLLSAVTSEDDESHRDDYGTIKFHLSKFRFLLIQGGANSGKSVLTKRLAYYFCQDFIENNSETYVPVLIDIKAFDPSVRGLEDLIARELRVNSISLDQKDVFTYLSENNFILIVDSYDECIDFQRLKAEIYSIPKNIPIIITSRNITEANMLKELQPQILTLGELNNTEKDQLIRNHLKSFNSVKAFTSELQDQELQEIETNPLLLQLLLLYYDNQKKVAKNIYELYHFLLHELLGLENKVPDGIGTIDIFYEVRRNFLRDISFHMQMNKATALELTVFENYLYSWLKEKSYEGIAELVIGIKNNLLLSNFLILKRDEISFFHRSFQDFFASELNLPAKVSSQVFKKWFKERFHQNFLKFFFARTQNLHLLQYYRPKHNTLLVWKFFDFLQWVETYADCLGMLTVDCSGEKNTITELIKSSTQKYIIKKEEKNIFLPHPSHTASYISNALGYLNFRPATKFYFELVRDKSDWDKHALKSIGHFRLEYTDCDDLLTVLMRINPYSLEHDNINKQVKVHASTIGTLIIEKYILSSEDNTKSELLSVLSYYFTNHSSHGTMPDKQVFEFIIDKQFDTGYFTNNLSDILWDEKNTKLHKQYNELFYNSVLTVFKNDESKVRKANALKGIMVNGRKNSNFENIFVMGICDDDDDVIINSIIWLPYTFSDKKLQSIYLERLYLAYDRFPKRRGDVLNSINRVDHDISDIEKLLIQRSISGETYWEVANALFLIRRFHLTETYWLLNDLLRNEAYLLKLRCKVIETMIYLNPQLFVDEFNIEFIREYNGILLGERDVTSIKKIISEVLQYIGNEDTVTILIGIRERLKEDVPNRYLSKKEDRKLLNFDYLDSYNNDKEIRPFELDRFIDKINNKIQHVRDFVYTSKTVLTLIK